MSVLPILFYPEIALKLKAKTVEKITPEILKLFDDMLETMYDAPGIGLAAPQIGVLLRIAVIDIVKDEEEKKAGSPLYLINPEVIASSNEKTPLEEGCLSLPRINVEVMRPEKVTVKYTDRDGSHKEIQADGLLAKCLQHEIDHLDGKLIIDYLTPLKRNMVMRRYQKMLKNNEDE